MMGLGALAALRTYVVTRFGERIGADLRLDLHEKLLALSPDFHARMRSGEAVARLTADVGLIQTFLTSSASMLVRTLLNTGGALALMLWLNWKLGGALLLMIPLAMLPLLGLGRRVRALSNRAQGALAEAGAEAAETLDAIELVQAYGQERPRSAGFRAAVEDTFAAAMRLARTRAAMILVVMLVFLGGLTGVLWLGARQVAAGDMSAGDLAAMVMFALYAGSGFGMLAEVWGEVMRAAGAADRASEVLGAEITLASPAEPLRLPQPVRGELAFEGVSFTHTGASGASLSGVSFRVRPGEFVALVGPSGAGKSTVLRLALRLADPQAGRVSLDGVDARLVRLQDWRGAFAYVPQEATLFTGSVRANVGLAREGLSDAELTRALGMAQAEAFLRDRGGLDADLGKRGQALSGGQRQRLAIARAFARNAPVLLLDEATSALDSESEAAIQGALDRVAGRQTLIVVAHRLSTVRRADRILVMDEGRIAEEGDHDALMRRDGVYARLARLQFLGEAEVAVPDDRSDGV
jgi:ATP-binding cassette subfamily B protein